MILTFKINYIISVDDNESINFYIYRGDSYIDTSTDTIVGGELIAQDLQIGSTMAIQNRSIYYTTIFDIIPTRITTKYKLYYKINSDDDSVSSQGIIGYDMSDITLSNYNLIVIEQYNDIYSILNNNNIANFSNVNIDKLKVNNIDVINSEFQLKNEYTEFNIHYDNISKKISYSNKLIFSCNIIENLILSPNGINNIIGQVDNNIDDLVYSNNEIIIKNSGYYNIKLSSVCFLYTSNTNYRGSYYVNIYINGTPTSYISVANIDNEYNFLNPDINNLLSCNIDAMLQLSQDDSISFIFKRNSNNLTNNIVIYSGDIVIKRI